MKRKGMKRERKEDEETASIIKPNTGRSPQALSFLDSVLHIRNNRHNA
jgi:hypothetical protein